MVVMWSMKDKKIIVILTGGVAAQKSLGLVRALREECGTDVHVVATRAAMNFVSKAEIKEASGHSSYDTLFSIDGSMPHIDLMRDCSLIVIAPATANFLARMAHGMADCLATTLLLANRGAHVMVAASMNGMMWRHQATQDNVKTLMRRGIQFMGPSYGELACGDIDEGRMMEIHEIKNEIENFFVQQEALSGRHIIVTAGATLEPLDDVRFLSNHSSGKQGYAIASSLALSGATVTLVSGAAAAYNFLQTKNVTLKKVTDAQEMKKELFDALPADCVVMVAAVADWRPRKKTEGKISSHDNMTSIPVVKNPDILRDLAKSKQRPPLLIGFAAQNGLKMDDIKAKKQRKNCDWLIVNDIQKGVMGADDNEIILLKEQVMEAWHRQSKVQIAQGISRHIADFFKDFS